MKNIQFVLRYWYCSSTVFSKIECDTGVIIIFCHLFRFFRSELSPHRAIYLIFVSPKPSETTDGMWVAPVPTRVIILYRSLNPHSGCLRLRSVGHNVCMVLGDLFIRHAVTIIIAVSATRLLSKEGIML